jgi:hypothetical protein
MPVSSLPSTACALIVADEGDDSELSEAFENSFVRAGDRLAGFGMGMVVFAAAVALMLFARF